MRGDSTRRREGGKASSEGRRGTGPGAEWSMHEARGAGTRDDIVDWWRSIMTGFQAGRRRSREGTAGRGHSGRKACGRGAPSAHKGLGHKEAAQSPSPPSTCA